MPSNTPQAQGCRLAWSRRKTIERNHTLAVEMIDKWLNDGGKFDEKDIKCIRYILTSDVPDMMRKTRGIEREQADWCGERTSDD